MLEIFCCCEASMQIADSIIPPPFKIFSILQYELLFLLYKQSKIRIFFFIRKFSFASNLLIYVCLLVRRWTFKYNVSSLLPFLQLSSFEGQLLVEFNQFFIKILIHVWSYQVQMMLESLYQLGRRISFLHLKEAHVLLFKDWKSMHWLIKLWGWTIIGWHYEAFMGWKRWCLGLFLVSTMIITNIQSCKRLYLALKWRYWLLRNV